MDKIICVGKNYLNHSIEMNEVAPESPIIFFKPPSSVFYGSKGEEPLTLPSSHGVIHHELELVFRIHRNSTGKLSLSHWTVGLDLTARDLQKDLKSKGHPWERAKAFPRSAVIGEFKVLENLSQILNKPFALNVNGELRQRGFGKDMRWSPESLLEDLKIHFEVCDGDLLFTGTPEGVGPLESGDHLILTVEDELNFSIDVA